MTVDGPRRRCVVKQLKPSTSDLAAARVIRERFRREAAILESLGAGCAQIPALQVYFAEGDDLYLVQDQIEGRNLLQVLREEGVFSESRVKALLVELLTVLDYIHSRGIIHRDIKPENVMLCERGGLPVLIDFGAVKEVVSASAGAAGGADSSIVIGSPGFMPLEQAAGKPVFASDLYSLGLTAVCLLTGRRPQEVVDLATGEISWHDYAENVSPELTAVLEKAIRPLPQERYMTAREMLEALHPADTPADLTLVAKRAARYSARCSGRAPGVYVAALLSAVLLVGGLLAFAYASGRGTSASYGAPQAEAHASPPNERAPNKSASGARAAARPGEGIERPSAGAHVAQSVSFRVAETSDRFTSVRAAPTTRSKEHARLNPGARVICEAPVRGETLWRNDEWRHCPAAGGYVHSKLLIPE